VVSGTSTVAAVIGTPIRHSLSPAILNAGFAAAGLDWVFVAFDVAEGDGPAAIDACRALGLGGLSVTMPHKESIIGALDELTPVAVRLGAVNCVVPRDGRLVGDNTDGEGFVSSLRDDHGVDVAGLRVVVLGAGGAARAVIGAIGDAGAAEVAVVGRTPARVDVAVAIAPGVARVGSQHDVTDADLVVNATPVGMGDDDRLPVDPSALRSGQVVADLVYHPLRTPLLAAAAGAGATPVDGLGMLVGQAAVAFERWTGLVADRAAMRAGAEAELSRR
jgi:shikimate dehydrogenase